MKYIIGMILFLILGLVGIFIFAPATLLNMITPSESFNVEKNIKFGDHPRFKLDIYNPVKPKRNSPVVIFVHGGSWSTGNKNMYKFIGESLTSAGLTTVIPDYRLYPNTLYPEPITDTAKAIAWAAQKYPERSLVVMGHSAGAYNVLMAGGLVSSFLKAEAVDPCKRVSGIVSIAGPTGIKPLTSEPAIFVFPDRFTKKDAAMNNVLEPSPPVLFLHGAEDTRVYPENSKKLAEKISARGGLSEVKIYPDLDHIDVVKVLSRYFDDDSALKSDLLNFINTRPRAAEAFCL